MVIKLGTFFLEKKTWTKHTTFTIQDNSNIYIIRNSFNFFFLYLYNDSSVDNDKQH